ncbi:MAG: 5-formyltetrahydrofolate cyclo-ligase [Bacteroidota bacterium]
MIRESKQALRKQMTLKRENLDSNLKKVYDQWICEQLLKIILKQNYQKIHAFLSIGSEINIFPLIKLLLEQQIQVTCPQTLGKRQLRHLVLSSLEAIETGKYGTQYPTGRLEYSGPQDLIIVPGLAFDRNCFRLGYGGGYYDAFLKNQPNAYKIGIAYPFQIVAEVPKETHDQQLNQILCKEDWETLNP